MQALERYYKAKYERFKALLKWRDQLPELLEAARSVLPDAEVYVFGSALRNELTANSDVDILVVSDKATGSQRHKLAVAIEEKLRNPFIFEIHLTTKEKLSWYKKHAKELVPAEQLIQEVNEGDARTKQSPTRF
ncbi:MAG: nucleotidyltransferase domain-containing protein [Candidatus Nezhaarchaeales archaeon]